MADWSFAVVKKPFSAAPLCAVKGDFIAKKPLKDVGKWTPRERREFTIVTMRGLTEQEAADLLLPQTDADGNVTAKRRYRLDFGRAATEKAVSIDAKQLDDHKTDYHPLEKAPVDSSVDTVVWDKTDRVAVKKPAVAAELEGR